MCALLSFQLQRNHHGHEEEKEEVLKPAVRVDTARQTLVRSGKTWTVAEPDFNPRPERLPMLKTKPQAAPEPVSNEYPKMLYRYPAQQGDQVQQLQDGAYAVAIAEDAEDHKAGLEQGWFETSPEAKAAGAPKQAKK
jgi:hypothetical protein